MAKADIIMLGLHTSQRKERTDIMRKDRLATLTMDIVVNHPTKRAVLDLVHSRISPWAQTEWDCASDGVSITERAARLDHSIREQRRCDESLIEHIFAALNGRTFVVLDATYCFMTQRMLDRRTGRRILNAIAHHSNRSLLLCRQTCRWTARR